MFIEMTVKIFADCCICFALLGAVPSLLPYSYPLLLPALICAVAAGLSAFLREKGRYTPSRFCAAIPLTSLLLAGGPAETIVLFPVILYTGAVILRGRGQLEYYNYQYFFLRSLALLGVMWAVLSICAYLEDPKGVKDLLIHTDVILRYGIVYLVCGIALQRQLRLGAEKRAHGNAGQMAAMLGSAGSVAFGFLVAEPMLRQSAVDLAKALFTVILLPVAAVQEAVAKIIMYIDEELKESPEYQEALEHMEERNPSVDSAYQDLYQELIEKQEGVPLWVVLVVAAGVLIALILMFLAFAKARGEIGALVTVEVVDAPRKGKRPSRLSNRGKVRQLYREFLRQEKKRGMKLKKHYTTEHILQRLSGRTDEKAAQELRDIYIRARYDEVHDVSRAQAEAARSALKRSRGETRTAAGAS